MDMLFMVETLYSIVSIFGMAGGGGSSSGGGGSSFGGGGSSRGGSSSGSGGIGVVVLVFLCFLTVFMYMRMSRANKKRIESYSEAGKKNLEDAKKIFLQYQADWTNFKLQDMKSYMTESYYKRACLMMELLQKMHRQNVVEDASVKICDYIYGIETDSDMKKIRIIFSAKDIVKNYETGEILYKNTIRGDSEVWCFKLNNNGNIVLDAINQPTESASHLVKQLDDFANEKGMFYSLDWGRYALPNRGLIFDGSSLYNSDVNNHVIGKWNDILVQMYTYAKAPNSLTTKYFLIGQLTVPKKYDGIIIVNKKEKRKLPKIPRNYKKYELEWGEFNDKFEVFATNIDKITSFELLNPKVMAMMYDSGLDFNLEVVDDNIYFFAKIDKGGDAAAYAKLLDILVAAYHELKM